MKWRGIRRQSLDVSTTSEEGLLAVNSRFKVDGEMRRRRALARSSIERKNAAVTNISGFSAFQSNVMAALTDGDRIQGYLQPYSLWGDNPDYTPLFPAPAWGYTLDETLDDLVGANPLTMSGGVYLAWAGAEPKGWFTNSTDSGSASVAPTFGGATTVSLGLHCDDALGNLGSYIQVDMGRWKIQLFNGDRLDITDSASTIVFTTPTTGASIYMHVTLASDGVTVTVYIDAVAVGTFPDIPAEIATVSIDTYSNGFGTVGICDLFAWWVMLSEDQIADVVNERTDRPWS